jgi:hypothetical protein
VIYGFDAFEGLPEDWFLGVRKGHFSLNGEAPTLNIVQNNYRLVKGWFADSVPYFTGQIEDPCAFLHTDCALYSSAKTVLHGLADHIVPGTVIVFDRYFNYPGWQKHGFRAFREFCEPGAEEFPDPWPAGAIAAQIVLHGVKERPGTNREHRVKSQGLHGDFGPSLRALLHHAKWRHGSRSCNRALDCRRSQGTNVGGEQRGTWRNIPIFAADLTARPCQSRSVP